MKIFRKLAALLAMVMLMGSVAVAVDVEQFADVTAYSATTVQPRWSYIYKITNTLDINQYQVTVRADTNAYPDYDSYVTAVLQQKQANGTWVDYATFEDSGHPASIVAGKLTVPYGTYRITSYHSAGDGVNMEYKSLVGPAKRVPFGDLA